MSQGRLEFLWASQLVRSGLAIKDDLICKSAFSSFRHGCCGFFIKTIHALVQINECC